MSESIIDQLEDSEQVNEFYTWKVDDMKLLLVMSPEVGVHMVPVFADEAAALGIFSSIVGARPQEEHELVRVDWEMLKEELQGSFVKGVVLFDFDKGKTVSRFWG